MRRMSRLLLLASLFCGLAASTSRAAPGPEPLRYQEDGLIRSAAGSSDWGTSWTVIGTGVTAAVGIAFAVGARRQDQLRRRGSIGPAPATPNDIRQYDPTCGKAADALNTLAHVG